MANNLTTWSRFSYTDDRGNARSAGLRTTDAGITVSLGSEVFFEMEYSLADAAKTKVWDRTIHTSDFDYLFILTSQNMNIQLTSDSSGVDKFLVLEVVKDIPFILGSDYSESGGAVDGFNGTARVLGEVWLENLSGSTGLAYLAVGT